MSRVIMHARIVLLTLAVAVFITAAPVLPSPGRWIPDASGAAAAEIGWVDRYLAPQPHLGDRIPVRLWVAWAEGEPAWARAYLRRQTAALDRVFSRSESRSVLAQLTRARSALELALREVASWTPDKRLLPNTAAGQLR